VIEHGFTTRQVAEATGLSPTKISHWARAGLVLPALTSGGDAIFSFQDVVLFRTARDLLNAEVPERKIRAAVAALRRQLPSDLPLSALRISSVGGGVIVQDEESTWEPATGQLHRHHHQQHDGGDSQPGWYGEQRHQPRCRGGNDAAQSGRQPSVPGHEQKQEAASGCRESCQFRIRNALEPADRKRDGEANAERQQTPGSRSRGRCERHGAKRGQQPESVERDGHRRGESYSPGSGLAPEECLNCLSEIADQDPGVDVGNTMRNVVPAGPVCSSVRRPPSASTAPRASERPRPVPASSVPSLR